jgi:N-acetylneuraminic acid mutarotase
MNKIAALLLVLVFLSASCTIIAKPALSSEEITENSWTTKAPMHEARAFLGVAAVNGKIYAIGGDNGSYMGNVANAWGHTNSVVDANEEYDPANDTWAFRTPMPTARAGLTAAVYKNRIYCIGGWTEDYSNTNANEVYDPATDKWETKASIPKTDTFLTANVVDGKIYVLPLWTTGTFEVYDPETDSWFSRTTPPYEITGFTSAVIGNKIYYGGGMSSTNYTMKYDIQIYDTVSASWSGVTTRPPSFDLYGCGGTTSGDIAPERIYFFMDNVTNAYDPANDNWTVGASMPTIRYCNGAAVVNDTFYVIGGRSGQWGYFVDMRADASNEQYIPFGYGTLSPKPKPEPFPTTLAITVSGASLAAIAVGVLVYFKKRKH